MILVHNQPANDETPEVLKEMLDIIEDVNQYALDQGTNGGLDWGIPCFNDAFDGLNTGLHIIGGQPNVGKSSLCLQMAWNIAKSNKVVSERCNNKAYVLYFALDDTARDILPRVIANEKKIPINVVKKPLKYRGTPEGDILLRKRSEGFRILRNNISHFKLIDMAHSPGCEYLETISNVIARHNTKLRELDEHYKLVVFIDNMHDIEVEDINFGSNENSKFVHIAKELSNLCNMYDIPMICTAEFRKLNGTRRPISDDVREAGKIAYEAKAILLCYNEVGLRDQSAQVYWQADGSPIKQPVLEVMISKNKLSEKKGRLFFEFMPALAYLREATPEGTLRYNQMIMG